MKLEDQIRDMMRFKHLSLKTEEIKIPILCGQWWGEKTRLLKVVKKSDAERDEVFALSA